jgi:acetolactate synthase-1/2/3 large subunit
MKISDYIVDFLANQGVKHVFAVTGGASLHLIDSIARHPAISYICPQHEQAGAMAADAYARATGNLGVAVSTSGPGATNMLTGVCGAYYDSVPVLYITGQVATFRMKGETGVRQVGFQETDTVDIYKPVTKYAVCVKEPTKIRYELEKACHIARSGRPGPVLLDIPDNIQREAVEPTTLGPFAEEAVGRDVRGFASSVDECIQFLHEAKRPVIIFGWGIRSSKAEKEAETLLDLLGFPVVTTWAVADLIPAEHPGLQGTFGTHGTRYGNFAVQNADLILSIGSRLDTKATGSPMSNFARGARKIIVDVDATELNKFHEFGMNVELLIQADARDFLVALNQRIGTIAQNDAVSAWRNRIHEWRKRYPICPPEYYLERDVNPYVFIRTLSNECREGETLVVDTGCAIAWMMQAFEFKNNQRLYHDWNNTAMGWALPASIGASLAGNRHPVVCVTGDGSLQMNIQELATIRYLLLPVKIFLISNEGYSMIRQTQEQWLDGRYEASTVTTGLAFPDFCKIAEAYGYRTLSIGLNRDLPGVVKEVLQSEESIFCTVHISPEHRVIPQVKFGRPNEDMEPLLERPEFLENMIVDPAPASLK